MNSITVYSTNTCPYCVAAKTLLTKNGLEYIEHNVALNHIKFEEMLSLSSQRTVPQIVINDQHIGGYNDLVMYLRNESLDND